MSDADADKPVFQRLDQTAGYPYSLGEYARRFAWAWVWKLLIRPSPPRAFGWRRFWLRQFGAKLAPTSRFFASARVRHPWLLEMGEWAAVGEAVNIYNLGPVTIGDHSVVSQHVHLCAGTHDHTKPNLPLIRPPIHIGRGVWVCADAFIGPGVTIADNALVGARAVVVKDVPEATIVAGNPAREIGPRQMEAASKCRFD
ncbi:MAG: putative colanic acid biosynthesis acetyltransferase [Rhodospirillales bacterium]|nr:putative colanic acid biosynthesis acetyltransferase [Rhodospirillales bacterium]